jgi:hypothetical protein
MIVTMTTALEYLESARRELLADRARIEREIGVLEETIIRLQGLGASGSTSSYAAVVQPSIRNVVLEVAGQNGERFTLAQVVEAAQRAGSDAKYESISSVLSRLRKDGVLEKVGRGAYRLPPTKSEASAESAEASVNNHWTSAGTDAPDQEGENGDPHRDHHPAPLTGDN